MRFAFPLFLAAGVVLIAACQPRRAGVAPVRRDAPPPALLGNFVDDYGGRHTITAQEWLHHPRSRYRIVRWHSAGQFVIAQNAVANPGDGGLWTRIDWMTLGGMSPWEWAFCLSAYNAVSAAAAESTRVARRGTPRTGCNGHPFSRMRPASPRSSGTTPP